MVVTAGPGGGGGLQFYGVLKGGRVYTVYLPMPGKSWILQYCARDNLVRNEAPVSGIVVVRLDSGLVAPSPQEQFDFHRPPLSKHTTEEMIVLQGVVREDGSVSDLRIVQGLLNTVDQAAMAAFGRWRFRPALRDGKPVAVEVLVGIPALAPET
jgi:TonB family protein